MLMEMQGVHCSATMIYIIRDKDCFDQMLMSLYLKMH